MRMFCVGCGWSYTVNPTSAAVSQCPVCYGTSFSSDPQTELRSLQQALARRDALLEDCMDYVPSTLLARIESELKG